MLGRFMSGTFLFRAGTSVQAPVCTVSSPGFTFMPGTCVHSISNLWLALLCMHRCEASLSTVQDPGRSCIISLRSYGADMVSTWQVIA